MGIETATLTSAIGGLAPALQIGGAFLGASGAYSASAGTKAAYNAQAQVDENNARITEVQAKDAEARGVQAADVSRSKTRQLAGTQRATMAANGVDLGVGSAVRIQNDTEYFGEVDSNTILDNAAREAWGYRAQGSNFSNQATMMRARAAAESPGMAATTSLLTSAGKVAASWYQSNRGTAGTPAVYGP